MTVDAVVPLWASCVWLCVFVCSGSLKLLMTKKIF